MVHMHLAWPPLSSHTAPMKHVKSPHDDGKFVAISPESAVYIIQNIQNIKISIHNMK